jgi:lipopolysaccharide assembly protein A
MQAIVWILRLIVVVILVWFAARNSDAVKLRGFLPDQTWEAPLVFVLLVVFVAGMVIGLLAWVPTVVRQRREIGRVRKQAAQPPPGSNLPVAPATEPPHGI